MFVKVKIPLETQRAIAEEIEAMRMECGDIRPDGKSRTILLSAILGYQACYSCTNPADLGSDCCKQCDDEAKEI